MAVQIDHPGEPHVLDCRPGDSLSYYVSRKVLSLVFEFVGKIARARTKPLCTCILCLIPDILKTDATLVQVKLGCNAVILEGMLEASAVSFTVLCHHAYNFARSHSKE